MKKECLKLIRELKKIFPDATDYSADAGIATWADNCKSVRYTAHARPMFCAVVEPSVDLILEMAKKEKAELDSLEVKNG